MSKKKLKDKPTVMNYNELEQEIASLFAFQLIMKKTNRIPHLFTCFPKEKMTGDTLVIEKSD
jgi:hypothetical protein